MISLNFVSGIETPPLCRYPKMAGLTHRFAVIQHNTYAIRENDMTFDERLWRALIAFISDWDRSATITAAENWDDIGQKERSWAEYIIEWQNRPAEDRDPPEAIVMRNGQDLRFCMLTEPWDSIGGVYPYADSCTHSLFSDCDIGERLLAFLHAHPDAARWEFDDKILKAEDITVEIRRYGHAHRLRTVLEWTLFSVVVVVLLVIMSALNRH